jgi:DNA-binding transcriptional LysR family regulator
VAIDIVASMRVFAAIVEAGTFAGAADRLDLSRAMVTRHVALLEEHLGARLLHRTTRRLSLTEAGHDLLQRALQIVALVEEAESAAAEGAGAPRGTLRITAPEIFGTHHLVRAISEYVQQHPGVDIDLVMAERTIDLVEEGFDLALRVSRSVAPGLVARRIAPARVAACAAPAYLERCGVPQVPEDLAAHNCLVYASSTHRNDWRFRRNGEERTVRVQGNFRCNTGEALMRAALDGLGVIYEPTFLVHEALRRRHLVRVLPDWQPDVLTLNAVYVNRKFLPPKVRSFIDFLLARIGPEPYWDEGLA